MILDYSSKTTPIQEAYKNMYQVKQYEIVTEGGLGIFLGGLAGFLVGGPIAAIAGAYIGHKAEEIGVGKFLKNMLFITGGVLVGAIGGPLGALAGGIGGFSLAKKNESIEEDNTEIIDEATDVKKPIATAQFKELFKTLDAFLKDKTINTLKHANAAVSKLNTASIVNKLDKATQQRLVKIYVFISVLYSLHNKNDKESKAKYDKILSSSSKDIAATAANILSKK